MTIRDTIGEPPGPRGGLGLHYSAAASVKEKHTSADISLWPTSASTSAEEAVTATAPPTRSSDRICISATLHGTTLRLTANGGRDSVDPDGCFCCCPMPPPCLVCCCAGHVRGTGTTSTGGIVYNGNGANNNNINHAVRVRYDAPSGILTRVDGLSGKYGLIWNQDWGHVSPGTTISSFRCGLTPCCAHDAGQFDLMSDGTIVPRRDHAVCVGFDKRGRTVLVPVGHDDACVFDDVLACAAPASVAMGR